MKVLSSLLMGLLLASARAQTPPDRLLYNGIVLPPEWPPTGHSLGREPASPPPYLVAPPRPIPIDVGRQLFVDDFLIEQTTLRRSFHLPAYHAASPVLVPDQPWEGTHAAPFSDGVWYDSADRLFKMWYWAGGGAQTQQRNATCLATSPDGLRWTKPALDVVPGTNIVLIDDMGEPRNSSTVWLDHREQNPERRFKMFRNVRLKSNEWHLCSSYSPDGVHWSDGVSSSKADDRTTVFYNGLRNVWVASLRAGGPLRERVRAYHESASPEEFLRWRTDKRQDVDWMGADDLDPARADLELLHTPARPFDLTPSQLYNLDCVAYESVLLGLFSIWRGQQVKPLPKINELCVGFSRDGFHWSRPDRRPFCPVQANEPVWNSGNLQSSGGCCLVVGEQLYFYVGAVAKGSRFGDPMNVGLATLRRDGFASMDAAEEIGTLTTRPVTFTGKFLFVNAAAASGELRVEVLDEANAVLAESLPIAADGTAQRVAWPAPDLSGLAGKPVCFRFHLRRGELYSFWVSEDEHGASKGFVAAGGPGFDGDTDRPHPQPK